MDREHRNKKNLLIFLTGKNMSCNSAIPLACKLSIIELTGGTGISCDGLFRKNTHNKTQLLKDLLQYFCMLPERVNKCHILYGFCKAHYALPWGLVNFLL